MPWGRCSSGSSYAAAQGPREPYRDRLFRRVPHPVRRTLSFRRLSVFLVEPGPDPRGACRDGLFGDRSTRPGRGVEPPSRLSWVVALPCTLRTPQNPSYPAPLRAPQEPPTPPTSPSRPVGSRGTVGVLTGWDTTIFRPSGSLFILLVWKVLLSFFVIDVVPLGVRKRDRHLRGEPYVFGVQIP